ncbi:hypothetical protein [Botrimarina mediterranea]|uniref:Dockerin domain-containing protein n=1 Tax=Botrimarina mediterranea TaxID=2528022 RepID=A0A518KB93_9BACT|nr:hypothetical protein [Botrimarina mediterranea]QDV75074.1 hypothetical protein Spa11_32830 [Botrimarina mediterranea]QDV79720.1 hypothetical protein K2D_33350 [Planctomycetes bacterium K2D]
MRTRTALAGIAAWLLGLGTVSHAAYTVPAVNLPAQTPDIVRDRVARSLASTRDQVGRVLHPFRGEFHGLGIGASRYSFAADLSGDGRVVVGYDVTTSLESRPFVWSPATGKTAYNMQPSGVLGNAFPTSISANGVYVGGHVTSSNYFSSGFLWSLASNQRLPTTLDRSREVNALSGDGKIAVGTQYRRYHFPGTSGLGYHSDGASDIGPDANYAGDLENDDDDTPSQWAYRYTRGGVLQEPGVLTSGAGYYLNSAAVDVTRDGRTVLLNGSNPTIPGRSEPFLWAADGTVKALCGYDHLQGESHYYDSFYTQAYAISADGTTVVGSAENFYFDVGWQSAAVFWRESIGWTNLGEIRTRPDQFINSAVATGVSGDGSVVIGEISSSSYKGQCIDCESTPFLWDEARGMRELSAVLQLDYGLDLSGWTLNEATGISDDGTTIIGNGRNPTGQNEAWRAVLARTTPLGDIDFDGDVDPQDYAQLKLNLGANSADSAVFYADGDLNADGRVDQADADTLLSLYQGRKQGDFNADGVVNIADYTVWRDHLGQFTGGLADSNGNGWVNHADLASWRSHFGRVLGALLPLSIPEPAAALLAATSLAFVSQRR